MPTMPAPDATSSHEYHILVSTFLLVMHLEEKHDIVQGRFDSRSDWSEVLALHETLHPELEERRQAERNR